MAPKTNSYSSTKTSVLSESLDYNNYCESSQEEWRISLEKKHTTTSILLTFKVQ